MENIKKELEQLKEQQLEFKKQQEEVENKITELENKMIAQKKKIDFSKWIGRYFKSLVIKGNKYLKSCADLTISYGGHKEAYYNDVSYKEGKMEDLKYGDVFILKDDLDDIQIYKFGIFIGKDDYGDYVAQYVGQNEGLEVIKYSTYFKNDYEDNDIIIFNRF